MSYFLGILALIFIEHSSVGLQNKQRLYFSDTQTWFDYAEKVTNRKSYLLEMDDSELAFIKPPPDQDSLEAQRELNQLIHYQMLRANKDIEQINREISFCGWELAGYQLGSHPKQDDQIIKILFDVSKIGFRLKKKFDRVRPSFLDNRIIPAIAVPDHAAYPSNHSVEAHLLALILGDLYPNLKNKFWQAANSIAKNREIAGVHYASDTAAGIEVAQAAFRKLKEEQLYQQFIINNKNANKELPQIANSSIICQQLIDDNIPK